MTVLKIETGKSDLKVSQQIDRRLIFAVGAQAEIIRQLPPSIRTLLSIVTPVRGLAGSE